MSFFVGLGVGLSAGLSVGLLWHWFIFAHYDEWIVENGGKLPPS